MRPISEVLSHVFGMRRVIVIFRMKIYRGKLQKNQSFASLTFAEHI